METISERQVWDALDEVKDPEIPTVSLVELGVVRTVEFDQEKIHLTMSPTFLGCPAIDYMREELEQKLKTLGFKEIEVELVVSPPWSSELISESGRAKMKAFGLAPPPRHDGRLTIDLFDSTRCPHCDSDETRMDTPFGKTLCRTMWYCNGCQQSFDQFKPL